jgi:hypothetical protein
MRAVVRCRGVPLSSLPKCGHEMGDPFAYLRFGCPHAQQFARKCATVLTITVHLLYGLSRAVHSAQCAGHISRGVERSGAVCAVSVCAVRTLMSGASAV